MHLNTLAGRSYNDLMQYPVFPWKVETVLVETVVNCPQCIHYIPEYSACKDNVVH